MLRRVMIVVAVTLLLIVSTGIGLLVALWPELAG
jgi:hypothetical protein